MEPISVVWFKRDLRLSDHPPLAAAIKAGRPILMVFAFEPALVESPESDVRHWRFAWQSVTEICKRLSQNGHRLYICNRNFPEVLREITGHFELKGLYSHQETGLRVSFDRDKEVKRICRKWGIPWHEWRQDGVIRGKQTRNGWWESWKADMQAPLVTPDLDQMTSVTVSDSLAQKIAGPQIPEEWQQQNPSFQPGGESFARRYFSSFVTDRAVGYTRSLSKPIASRKGCSRLSPYFAYGCISVREVYQKTQNTSEFLPFDREFIRFHERLWWRSHYIQKLETEYQIESEPINHGMKALKRPYNPQIFKAFTEGMTGYPLVDACIRCLHQNGYQNFRMRAMLATFATFILWQPMVEVSQFLAKVFLDYEPGLHYAQHQMQAGLSGYHPLRIFSPIIQAKRHDPEGTFIKQYIPELALVPPAQVATPWNLSPLEQQLYNFRIGLDYPVPIVPYEEATRKARDQYWEVRTTKAVQEYLPVLWERHCMPQDREKYLQKYEANKVKAFSACNPSPR
ncbi:MAG: FAD-binding domain-containing protein [Bacteroidota bacterium]